MFRLVSLYVRPRSWLIWLAPPCRPTALLSFRLPVLRLYVRPFICLSVILAVCLSINPFKIPFKHSSIRLCVSSSVRLSICPFVRPFVPPQQPQAFQITKFHMLNGLMDGWMEDSTGRKMVGQRDGCRVKCIGEWTEVQMKMCY